MPSEELPDRPEDGPDRSDLVAVDLPELLDWPADWPDRDERPEELAWLDFPFDTCLLRPLAWLELELLDSSREDDGVLRLCDELGLEGCPAREDEDPFELLEADEFLDEELLEVEEVLCFDDRDDEALPDCFCSVLEDRPLDSPLD